MDSRIAYLQKLREDLLEQFRGKPNIEVLQKALARQLEEVYNFYDELNTLRWLKDAEGVQLDGIGDIVVLSRAEALILSQLIGKEVPMDDDTYRLYLGFKMHLNTSNCTHKDVYRALKMFWDETPLYYREKIEFPATIFFYTPNLNREQILMLEILSFASKIKAAGVALIINTPTEVDTNDYHAGATAELTHEFFYEETEIDTDGGVYYAGVVAEFIREFFTGDEIPVPTDGADYSAGAEISIVREYFMEENIITTEATSYIGGAVHEKIKEDYTEHGY